MTRAGLGWGLAAGIALGTAAASAPSRTVGEAIYVAGRASSGPVRGVVAGDVEIEGPSASCRGCHQRSGLGSFEGTSAAPPVIGRVLFAPRSGGSSARPAYDAATLARALRDGVDPAGRTLDALMPRFHLADDEVESLAAYLAGLSAGPSPGVDATTLHLATVVTPDADPAAVEATLEVLEAYVRTKNARTRGEGRPGKRDRAFREWSLLAWRLDGPEAGWPAQLERYYAATPVFALLSGAGGARWAAVHDFCERHGIPSILPNLDVLPPRAGQGFYNVYFSRGVEAEAEAVSAALANPAADSATSGRAPRPGAKVLQIHGDGVSAAAADSLRAALAARGSGTPVDLRSDESERIRAALEGATDVVLWLGGEELARSLSLLSSSRSKPAVYLSATLLADEAPPLPPALAARTTVARPYAVPAETQARFRRTSAWLRSQGISVSRARSQDQALAACGVLGEALMHAGTELVRDYVLEWIDHGGGMQAASSFYRSLAFGPSQRILSRGCSLGKASDPAPAPSLRPVAP